MRIKRRYRPMMLLAGVLLALLPALPIAGRTAGELEPRAYLPLVVTPAMPLLADHTHTDIGQIPDYWIEQARTLVVHYAHTSHGGQILSGLNWLAARDPRYRVDILASGTVAVPADSSALRVYDGNNYVGDTYITPEQYWESVDGISHTHSTLDSGWFDVSLWTWCGQMSYYSDAQIEQYIDVMSQLETDYPAVRFVYYTGHTDGSTTGSALWRHNDMVRQHVAAGAGILFDFADIESYDPAGNFYPTATDSCAWCADWCASHPAAFECQQLPYCAHSHGLQCTLKGQAFWWLMARLAGWDGH